MADLATSARPANAALVPTPGVVDAIRAAVGFAGMKAQYDELMRDKVFSLESCCDRTDQLRYQKMLGHPDAPAILNAIWKESPSVGEADLAAAGSKRSSPDGEVTSHGIAAVLAESARELDKVLKRVRATVEAAAAYGLVERFPVACNKVLLVGTPLLHEFMCALAPLQQDLAERWFRPSRAEDGGDE